MTQRNMILAFADFHAPQFCNRNSNEQSECFKDYTLQLADQAVHYVLL